MFKFENVDKRKCFLSSKCFWNFDISFKKSVFDYQIFFKLENVHQKKHFPVFCWYIRYKTQSYMAYGRYNVCSMVYYTCDVLCKCIRLILWFCITRYNDHVSIHQYMMNREICQNHVSMYFPYTLWYTTFCIVFSICLFVGLWLFYFLYIETFFLNQDNKIFNRINFHQTRKCLQPTLLWFFIFSFLYKQKGKRLLKSSSK